MRRKLTNDNGFGVIGILLVIVLFTVIGVGGAYVYHRSHKAKSTPTASSHYGSSNKGIGSTPTPASKPDPYAGWKTYADAQYHYSFKYPADWQLTETAATGVGATGGANLLSPSKTVQITYTNALSHDSGVIAFTPTYVNKVAAANEDLTLVGGYSPAGGIVGNYLPSYRVVDSSFLTTYPLTVGSGGQFPNNPGFTNKYAGAQSYQAALVSKPAISINTVADANSWLAGADGQISLKILHHCRISSR
ncbi:MAG TPA: hypothetical protein VLH38_00080 [Patescibacteria group bacterium]|nr:hypothetical protein [Patescibacteria group bacterium]